ncbi:hypothetical protein DSO57_1025612 [Entomophthora muscae]|uniref:Uncharacterized protein n=1 Tax=Entomophthora muscae TaxID=34485 RepID=A0ACC2SRJ9_9FUNG|nr:hypothetical protein DSO57_1025612 [Entomophthora muscae]
MYNTPNKNNISSSSRTQNLATRLHLFIGTVRYYSRSFMNYSNIACLLFKPLANNIKFEQTQAQEEVLNTIKEYLAKEPVLIHPDFTCLSAIFIDASEKEKGRVLAQEHNEIYCSVK